MSGYFLRGDTLADAITFERLKKVFKIGVAASLLYLPLFLLAGAERDLIQVLKGGTWFHLWFLSSLLFGLGALKLYFSFVKSSLLFAIIAMGLLSGYSYVDYAVSLENTGTTRLLVDLRFLQAAPWIWLGYVLRQSQTAFTIPKSACLTLAGAFLCLAEAQYLELQGAGHVNPQMPFGAFAMVFGIFGLFAALKPLKAGHLSLLGRKYALHVYLLHPVILTFLSQAGLFFGFSGNFVLLASLILAAPVAFALPVLLEKYVPWGLAFLGGDWSFVRLAKTA